MCLEMSLPMRVISIISSAPLEAVEATGADMEGVVGIELALGVSALVR